MRVHVLSDLVHAQLTILIKVATFHSDTYAAKLLPQTCGGKEQSDASRSCSQMIQHYKLVSPRRTDEACETNDQCHNYNACRCSTSDSAGIFIDMLKLSATLKSFASYSTTTMISRFRPGFGRMRTHKDQAFCCHDISPPRLVSLAVSHHARIRSRQFHRGSRQSWRTVLLAASSIAYMDCTCLRLETVLPSTAGSRCSSYVQ